MDILDLVEGELKTALAGSLKRVLKLATPLTFRSVHVVDGAATGNRWAFTIVTLDHVQPSGVHTGDWLYV